MRIRMIFIGVVLWTFTVSVAGAQEDPPMDLGASTDAAMMEELRELYGDEAFVTIATGSKKPIFKAPSVASVITAEEIKVLGARTLDEVIETVAGLHVSPSTQGRLDSIFSIRGIHTKFNPQVLVLMNGLPFPHFSGGRPFHFHLPLAGVSRLEIIRGPGSAVFGADAYSGVINIITKEADEIKGNEIGVRKGSFDTHDVFFLHGKKWGEADVAFSLEWQESEGDKGRIVGADFQSLLDSIAGTNASFAPGPLETRYNVVNTTFALRVMNWQFRHWFWLQDDAGLGAGSALALDPVGGEDLRQHMFDLNYRNSDILSNWDLSWNVNYLHRQSESRFIGLPPGSLVPIGADGNVNVANPRNLVLFPEGLIGEPSGKEDVAGADFVASYKGQKNHRIRIGTGLKRQRFFVVNERKNFGEGVIDGSQLIVGGNLVDVSETSYAFLPDITRRLWYVSLQDEWQFARDFELTAGIRYDRYSDFGGTINPRIALVWGANHNLTTKLLYGRAFRAPSFSEQFSANNPVGLGNPELKPETIDTLEFAIDYRPTFDFQSNFTTFVYKADNLIDFIQDELGTNIAKNAREQNGYGFEVECDWKIRDNIRLRSHYAWQRSKDSIAQWRIPDAPSQQFYASAFYGFLPNWIFAPQFQWIGGRKREVNDPRPEIDDYSLVHLTIRREKIYKKVDVAVVIRNLLDQDAFEPSSFLISGDYPLEGRQMWAELRYRF